MSSSEFSSELRPEARLRTLVILSAAAATLAGSALILQLPIGFGWRLLLLVCWIGHCSLETLILVRTWPRVTLIRIDNLGRASVVDRSGQTESVRLLAGSLVLGRIAWLRMVFDDGNRYAELLCGNTAEDAEWHRFQLVWQQTWQIIGRSDRS